MTLPDPLIVHSNAVMSGAAVFSGTRVPVQTLIDYLEEGDGSTISSRISRPSAATMPSPSWNWPSSR